MVKRLTIEETARAIGKTVKATRLDIQRGRLPYQRLGRRIVISESELEKFLSLLPAVTAEEAAAVVLQNQQKEANE